MAFLHGKDTVVKIDGNDYSEYSNSTDFGDETETHETTTYGRNRKTYQSGLGDGTITVGGIANNAIDGPRAIFKPLKAAGLPVPFIYQPEGAGSGKAQSLVDVIVSSFNESSPVGDNVAWTAELQMTGPLDETDQS